MDSDTCTINYLNTVVLKTFKSWMQRKVTIGSLDSRMCGHSNAG